MVVLRLTAATLLPIVLSALFTALERKTAFARWKEGVKQIVIGIAFGIFCILSTEYGVDTGEGVILNVRDAGPMCAGLFFGAPAGLVAGLIGGGHRWLCVYWGGGMITRVACSSATFLSGVFSGMMRRRLFEDSRPNFFSAFGLGATMEVLHMLLVLVTNLSDVSHAFAFVQNCAFTMILCNGLAVCLTSLVCGFSRQREHLDVKNRRISYDFAFWLFVCVAIAFFITSSFTQQIIYRITAEDAALYRSVTLYLVIFMEILIFTAIFILVYQMLKTKVVMNLYKVNGGLAAITDGDLDTVIDVRAYREFSELSDHVNATVATLKRYIREAEERIDQELEFARQIQHSALPSAENSFANRHDFDLFASMVTAKEVGGDFYDFYLVDHFTLVFLIADVSGKGIPAAMFMMRAKTLIRDLSESGRPVDEVFTEANRRLCEGNDADMFITAWIGRLDLRTGTLTYVNAGHNPPLLCRRGGKFEYLRSKPNFVLAGMDITRYQLNELQLKPGDALYLYTDGVTEAADEQNTLFGEERLETLLADMGGKPAEAVCGAVAESLRGFVGQAAQSDDITMLCVKMNTIEEIDSVKTHPDKASYTVMQDFLTNRLGGAGIPAGTQNRIQIVNDEIWSNIVHYSGAGEASLRLRREGDTLLLVYTDDGVPYDPTAEEEPDVTLAMEERPVGGLGLHMVRKMTASMTYERAEDENRLTLGFDIGQSGGTD